MIEMKKFFTHFTAAIGALSALVTLISWLNSIASTCYVIIVSLVILLLSTGYATVQIWPKKKLSIQLQPALKITIENGDLFEKKGVIVIPVNEYFDTIVDNKIIAENTIHGIFITKYFRTRIKDLDDKISDALAGISPIEETNRLPAKQKKYPLGTCARISEGGNDYILLAFAHFDHNNHAHIETNEYETIIQGLMHNLEYVANNRPVYMPLFGTGQSGVPKTAQRILSYILGSIDFNYPRSLPAGRNIVIKDITKHNINLSGIKDLWKVYKS